MRVLLAAAALLLPHESDVATFGDLTVVNVKEEGRYRLARVAGDRLEVLAVPPQRHAFDFDVGPDTGGRPVVVYSRDRRLLLHRPWAGGELELRRRARGSEPSIWGDRIAYVRRGGIVTGSRFGGPLRRVPGIPRGAYELDVEVRGTLIATLDRHGPVLGFAPNQYLRLYDAATGRSRRVWVNGTGLGGQRLVGLSFAGPWLGFYVSWFGDPSAVNAPRRYRVTDGRYEWASGSRLLRGFALLSGGETLQLEADAYQEEGEPNRLERRRLRWRRIPRRAIRD
ncbi:MAG TPA: hypothetical protein VHF89_01145 [Solirubrobacteraceae bacterium]|nr:hypothetical protein [Solirubrobacteraceae bacterium]